jgi:hypothetical protein
MRMLPARAFQADPSKTARVKRDNAQLAHISAPLKGLSLSSKLTTGDPLTAPILTNFTVEDDRIQARAGYKKLVSRPDGAPVWNLIPWYGSPAPKLAGASNNQLWDAKTAATLKTGFTSNDWHWTAFSNLSQQDFTVLVNGADGVWSWDGGSTAAATVTVTNLSKANPAVCTVAAADISKFQNGQTVLIAGATGTGMVNANGYHTISSVNSPANTFTLTGVDTSAASAAQTSGVTAVAQGSFTKEAVTAPPTAPWIDPNKFNIVLTHMNRLWFTDNDNLAIYYLPLQQKAGEVKYLPLNAMFRRGGSIRAIATWTLDGGAGMDDQLCVFSSNGELVVYSGTDPDGTDFSLVGIFRFDAPMSKHCVANYGGDLYVLISTGLVPMTTVIRAETERLAQSEKTVISAFLENAIKFRDRQGWQLFLNPSSGRMFCNIPQGGTNQYHQMIRHMPRTVWSEFQDVPARCWNWIDPYVYFGDDTGNVYEMHPSHLNDDGKPIRLDVQMAWSNYKTPAIKQFKMLKAYMITDGNPAPLIDFKVDYDVSPAVNQPDVSFTQPGADWNTATWDTDGWAGGQQTIAQWNGIAAIGRVGAPRLSALVRDATFAVAGWDVIYESGSVLG